MWDEDFEEGISLGRITGEYSPSALPTPPSSVARSSHTINCTDVCGSAAALDAPPVTSSDDEYDENTSTIRPSPRPSPTPSPTPPIDDYSDLAADDTNFENRVASLRVRPLPS